MLRLLPVVRPEDELEERLPCGDTHERPVEVAAEHVLHALEVATLQRCADADDDKEEVASEQRERREVQHGRGVERLDGRRMRRVPSRDEQPEDGVRKIHEERSKNHYLEREEAPAAQVTIEARGIAHVH